MKILANLCFLMLFTSETFFLKAQTISYDQSSQTFTIENLEPPTSPAGAKNPPYWKYFWEFGDGHYSMSENPIYCYENPIDHEVRVSLTPYYSYDRSRSITGTVRGNTSCTVDRSYQEPTGMVQITSNADGELVPGHEIQLAIDYKMPSNQVSGEGYLLFFYNSEKEKKALNLPFYPLTYARDSERLPSANKMVSVIPSQMTGISEEAKSYVSALQNEYQYKGFHCTIEPGSVDRVFLTVAANVALDTTIIKGKRGALNINLKSVWIPINVQFDINTMVQNYALQMLSVHDPNRLRIIRPYGPAYYSQKDPETLEYLIEFQNKGGRAVKQVDVVVPMDRNLNYKTIKITRRDPDEISCPVCATDFDPAISTASCFQLDTSQTEATGDVVLRFYNVMIHGKNEAGIGKNKFTKGFIQYTIETNKKRMDFQFSRASIEFEGGEVFVTKPDGKNWRHKSLGFKGGKNFGASLDGYEVLDDEISKWYNVAFVYKNAPLFQGVGYGVELGSSGFGFRSWSAEPAFDMEAFELTEEVLDIKTLDLQAQIEYRIGGVVSGGIGAGFSVPISGKGNISYAVPDSKFYTNDHWGYFQNPEQIDREVFEELNALSGFRDESFSKFGLFDNAEPSKIGSTDITSKTKIGSIINGYIETGLLSGIALGGRYVFRVYPNSYKQQCLKVQNAEIYLRVNLSTMK